MAVVASANEDKSVMDRSPSSRLSDATAADLLSSPAADPSLCSSNSTPSPSRQLDAQPSLRSEEYRQLFRLPPDEPLSLPPKTGAVQIPHCRFSSVHSLSHWASSMAKQSSKTQIIEVKSKRPTAAYLLYTHEVFKSLQKSDPTPKMNPQVEMIENLPDKTSSFVRAIANEVEKVIIPPMIKQIESTINEMLNVPSKALSEETPASAPTPPLPNDSPPSPHHESPKKAATPPLCNTPPLAPTSPPSPGPLSNVDEVGAMSSNITRRVKRHNHRKPSRHVTSPYEVAPQTYKRKTTKLEVSDEKKSDPSLVLVSDTSLPSSVNARDEEAIKEFACRPCVLPVAVFYYINYVKAGLNEELVLLSDSNEFLTRRDIRDALKERSWIESNVINALVSCLTNGTKENASSHVLDINWFFPTYFSGPKPAKISNFLKKYAGYMYLVERLNKIYISMNENDAHWYLVVVDVNENHVYILDTLHTLRPRKARLDQAKKVVDRMAIMLGELKDEEYGCLLKRMEISYADWVPQQPNGFDCGVLVMRMMMEMMTKNNCDLKGYDSGKLRLEVMCNLIMSSHNLKSEAIRNTLKPFVVDDNLKV